MRIFYFNLSTWKHILYSTDVVSFLVSIVNLFIQGGLDIFTCILKFSTNILEKAHRNYLLYIHGYIDALMLIIPGYI